MKNPPFLISESNLSVIRYFSYFQKIFQLKTKIGVKYVSFHLKLYEWLGIFCTEQCYYRLSAVLVSYPGHFDGFLLRPNSKVQHEDTDIY